MPAPHGDRDLPGPTAPVAVRPVREAGSTRLAGAIRTTDGGILLV